MGTPVPPPTFEIDPTKNYNVTVRRWLTFIEEACEVGMQAATISGIRTGAQIIIWLDLGFECTFNTLISPGGLFLTERIIDLEEVP